MNCSCPDFLWLQMNDIEKKIISFRYDKIKLIRLHIKIFDKRGRKDGILCDIT